MGRYKLTFFTNIHTKILFAASAFRKLSSIYVFSYFPFGFEGRIWDLIVSVPDHCLSFYYTDSKLFFLYTSCHPKHTRNSIPNNLARRLKTIVSDERTLHKRLEELEQFLIKRKYPLSLIGQVKTFKYKKKISQRAQISYHTSRLLTLIILKYTQT